MHDNVSRGPSAESILVVARFFGHFTCKIGEQSISWLRRMDKRVFQYLLLKPDGGATREELQSVFWFEQDPKSSSLSLRTACSNIRKAIGTLAGVRETENYFAAGNEKLSVNLERMNVDVRRYIAHIRAANFGYAADEWKAAYMHYKRAVVMYAGDIGWGDEPELWLEPLAIECAVLQRTAIERLAEISHKSGSITRALEYESMLTRDSGRSGKQGIA